MRLENKVAIITGGGQGIGKRISMRFAHEGAKVVIAQRTLARAQKLADELEAAGLAAFAVGCDVSERAQVNHLISATLDRFGPVDVLVNNAAITGQAAVAPFLEMTDQHWNMVVGVNLTGAFMCSQEVALQMVKQGRGGCIINISSVSGVSVEERGSAYCAAKAGVIRLTRAMALELAPYGITVNDIAPGDIRLIDGEPPDLSESELYSRQPLRRQGRPEDIAAAATYLASDEARFVTGTTLLVDGGVLCYWYKYEE